MNEWIKLILFFKMIVLDVFEHVDDTQGWKVAVWDSENFSKSLTILSFVIFQL